MKTHIARTFRCDTGGNKTSEPHADTLTRRMQTPLPRARMRLQTRCADALAGRAVGEGGRGEPAGEHGVASDLRQAEYATRWHPRNCRPQGACWNARLGWTRQCALRCSPASGINSFKLSIINCEHSATCWYICMNKPAYGQIRIPFQQCRPERWGRG